jgi:uncharacterized RDD family membrane protein YckC
MKCPKCEYIGLGDGSRCKNCGFDVSLLSESVHQSVIGSGKLSRVSSGRVGDITDVKVATSGSGLPLFGQIDDEEPMPQLRAGPRPPLSVRRTPDRSRTRAIERETSKSLRAIEEPGLSFSEDDTNESESGGTGGSLKESPVYAIASKRLGAAVIDLGLLCVIGVIVVYLTLRMVELPLGSWRLLPVSPMVSFFGLLAFAYYSTFTAVGGQTVGKMAMGVRVITTSGEPLNAAVALRRTAASLMSVATLGLGLLPALIGSTRLALHDRVAGTRVVDDSKT